MTSVAPEFLKGLRDEEAAAVIALGRSVTLAAGQPLFRLAKEADRLFVVLSGRVALTLPMQVRGREEDVLVEEKLPGETVGWSGLIPPHRFTLNATAAVASELLSFPREVLLAHFASRPSVGWVVGLNVAAVIGRRLQVFQTLWLREMQRVVELRYS